MCLQFKDFDNFSSSTGYDFWWRFKFRRLPFRKVIEREFYFM